MYKNEHNSLGNFTEGTRVTLLKIISDEIDSIMKG